jgi:hypothetical protein
VTTFGFRLRFTAPAGRSIQGADPEMALKIGGVNGKLIVKQQPHSPNQHVLAPETFHIVGSEFPSFDEARETGQRLKQALVICSISTRMGADVGHDTVTAGASTAVKDAILETRGVQLRDTVHGLDVYSESPPVLYFGASATGIAALCVRDFEPEISQVFHARKQLSPKVQLAAKIYNLKQFESSTETGFLSLVTAIEVLSERKKLSSAVEAEIEACQDLIRRRSPLSDAEREKLLGRLGNLKSEGISEACRRLVANHAGESAAEFFKKCYTARSELLHDGKTEEDVTELVSQLDELVRQVLLSCIDTLPREINGT